VSRALLHALVGASRFGLLLGLALWLGLGVALVAQLPLLGRRAPPGELERALVRRVERLLWLALVLVGAGLLSRVILDRAAPPTTLVLPVAGMVLSRMLAGLAVSPSLRVLRARIEAEAVPEAPAPDTNARDAAERTAWGRLEGARRLLLTLEVCLALYALYAIA
jgi:hypothetical protein